MPTADVDASPPAGALVWPVLLWAGLAFAFAPTLADGLEHLKAQPWTRATLIFPFLAFWAARAAPPAKPSRIGWLLIGAGIAIQLIAIAGGMVRAGRLGFVLAAIGLCRGMGWCSLPVALLLAFLLPLPHAVHELGSPWLEAFMAQVATAIAQALGVAVSQGRDVLTSGAATLRLADHDGGLGLMVLFAGLAGFVWLHDRRRSLARLARLVFGAGLTAGAVQLVSMTAAAVALAGTRAEPERTARAILDGIPWILTWTSGIVLAWKHRRIGGDARRDSFAGGGER